MEWRKGIISIVIGNLSTPLITSGYILEAFKYKLFRKDAFSTCFLDLSTSKLVCMCVKSRWNTTSSLV